MLKQVINFVKRLHSDEGGFIQNILGAIAGPLIGGAISGIFGGRAAQPAASAAESSAQAQAAMINELLKSYQTVFAPAQKELMGQYMDLSRVAPSADIAAFELINNLLPTYMPDILRSRAMDELRRGVERQGTMESEALTRRGIRGPAAEALLQKTRERGIEGEARIGSDIAAWEAQQTLANRDKAFENMLRLLGMAGQYSQVGSAFPGTAIAGAGDLTRTMMQQAGMAAQPWQQMGGNIGQALTDYFAKPGQPPVWTPTASGQYTFPNNPAIFNTPIPQTSPIPPYWQNPEY